MATNSRVSKDRKSLEPEVVRPPDVTPKLNNPTYSVDPDAERVIAAGADGNTASLREAGDEPVSGQHDWVDSLLNDPYTPVEGGQVSYGSHDTVRLSDTAIGGTIANATDHHTANPVSHVKMSAPAAHVSLGDGADGGMTDLIERIVRERVDAALAHAGAFNHKGGTQEVVVGQKTGVGIAPDKYLKHYRCDENPNMLMLELDMDKIESGFPRGEAVVKGRWIQFRRGHFFATTENQVRQIEFSRNQPMHDPTNHQMVVGGNPYIYEDDGTEILQCPVAGCGFMTASLNSLKAHKKATHGLE